MDDIAEEVEAFYAGYLAAWNARDLEGLDACFALPATFVSPMGTLAVNSRRELRAVLARNFERLQSEGFSQSSAGTLEVRTCADVSACSDEACSALARRPSSARMASPTALGCSAAASEGLPPGHSA